MEGSRQIEDGTKILLVVMMEELCSIYDKNTNFKHCSVCQKEKMSTNAMTQIANEREVMKRGNTSLYLIW